MMQVKNVKWASVNKDSATCIVIKDGEEFPYTASSIDETEFGKQVWELVSQTPEDDIEVPEIIQALNGLAAFPEDMMQLPNESIRPISEVQKEAFRQVDFELGKCFTLEKQIKADEDPEFAEERDVQVQAIIRLGKKFQNAYDDIGEYPLFTKDFDYTCMEFTDEIIQKVPKILMEFVVNGLQQMISNEIVGEL